MSLQTPEVMIAVLSKEVEALAKTTAKNADLFEQNQMALNTLIAELREHKAVDAQLLTDFRKVQEQIYGNGDGHVGLITHVHDLRGKVGSVWKVVWGFIGSLATGLAGYLLSGVKP